MGKKGEYSKYLIGEKYSNKSNNVFEIIGYSHKKNHRKIKFESGYVCTIKIDKDTILKARDYGSPTLCGKGIICDKSLVKHVLYKRWAIMIQRCYNPKNKRYKTYGAKGCYVSENWLRLDNYIKDIESKYNYEKLINDGWEIDKDILIPGNLCYDNNTTIIVSKNDNMAEMVKRRLDNKILGG